MRAIVFGSNGRSVAERALGPLSLFEGDKSPAVAKVAPHKPPSVATAWRDHKNPPDRADTPMPVDVMQEGVAGVRSG